MMIINRRLCPCGHDVWFQEKMAVTRNSIYILSAVVAGWIIAPSDIYSSDVYHKTGRYPSPSAIMSTDIMRSSEHDMPVSERSFVLTDSGKIQSEPFGPGSDDDPFSGRFYGAPNSLVYTPYIGYIDTALEHSASDPEALAAPCGPSPLDVSQIRKLVSETARKRGVDVQFAMAIAEAESQNDRLRNSPKGARGPMQLMPATAARYGINDLCDPAENIAGGVAYLKDLTLAFQNPMLVAAAYNAGEQSVYRHGGIPPFRETVSYVAKVMNLTMGITVPGKAAGQEHPTDDLSSPLSGQGTGIIQATKRGTFVAGVMQF
jgi:hypothetical protein